MGITLRASGLPELKAALKQYGKFNKRAPSEVVNAKLTFIAKDSTNTTKTADAGTILSKLKGDSEKFPNVPLDAILVNLELGKKGKKGLTGEPMRVAVEKLDKKEISKLQFARSGWYAAIKIMDAARKRGDAPFSNRFSPKQAKGLRQYGRAKGGAQYARPNSVKCSGYIENRVGYGKQASKTINKILLSGLEGGVQMEIKSILAYVEKKYQAELKRIFGKTI